MASIFQPKIPFSCVTVLVSSASPKDIDQYLPSPTRAARPVPAGRSNFKPTCYRLQCFLARSCGDRAILPSPLRNNYMLESLIHFLIERRPPMIMNFQLIICSFFFLVVDHLVLSVDDFRDIIKALVIGKSSNSKILTALPR